MRSVRKQLQISDSIRKSIVRVDNYGQYTHGAQGNGEYNDLNFTKTILTNGYPTDFSVVGTNDTRSTQTLENGQWHSSKRWYGWNY